jgi:hypothetical protein
MLGLRSTLRIHHQLRNPIIIIIKLSLYVTIHYIGTTKQALTLHVKPLGLSWESTNSAIPISAEPVKPVVAALE